MNDDRERDAWNYYERCPHCNRPARSKRNLRRLKLLILGGSSMLGLVGVAALPLAGFGLGGIAAGSMAASWQAAIGSVAAGSLFATLQSLGASGIGMLLFGSTSAALGLLGTVATRLGWCVCDLDDDQPNQNLLPHRFIRVNNANQNNVNQINYPIVEANEERVEQELNQQAIQSETCENSLNECPDCNQPMICVSNLNKVKKMIIENGLSATESPLNVLQSLEADQRDIFLSGDLTAAMHILASLANNSRWNWCMRSPIMEALTVMNNTNDTQNIRMNEVNYKDCKRKDIA